MPLIINNNLDINIKNNKIAQDIADDASVNLPDATRGIGMVQCGDEFAMLIWNPSGVPTIISASSLVETADIDNKFCIIDGGTYITLKNRLGATKRLIYTIIYK